MRSRAHLLLCVLAATACGREPRVRIDYTLAQTLAPGDVIRVETNVRVAPDDPRAFTADQSFRVVAPGVGYEVRDFDGTGQRSLLITHDSTLGYAFDASFAFTLLPPVGDAPPLAIDARAVGASQMLGKSDTRLATFSTNGEVTLLIVDQRCGGAACPGDEACCNGACATIQTDVQNCGGCGMACGTDGNSCATGVCRCEGGSACTAGQTCCGGLGCIDTSSDPFNCGVCGKACGPGESCTAGVCGCGAGGASCAGGQLCCSPASGASCQSSCACGGSTCDTSAPLCCSGGCHDPSQDNANCGGCDTKCAAGSSCKNGSCLCGGVTKCTGGDTCCATGCANLANDPLNCGACNNRCAPGSTCSNGQCKCGVTTCSPSAICCSDLCFDPQQSTLHCGGCNTACNQGESCVAGMCQCSGTMPVQHCTGTATCCPGMGCYDVSADQKHCGRMCIDCTPGACLGGLCQDGPGCPPCGPNQRCCGKTCTNIDDQHCSTCTDDCTAGGHICCLGPPPLCSPVANLCSAAIADGGATN